MKKIVIPTKLDIENLIASSNNKYYNSKSNTFEMYDSYLEDLDVQTIYYILYKIISKTIRKIISSPEKENYSNSDGFCYNDVFIELSSIELQKISRDYKKIMFFLCNTHQSENILFRKRFNSSSKGGHSFMYQINYKYLNNDFKLVEINKKRLIKKLPIETQVGSTLDYRHRRLKNDFQKNIFIDLSDLDLQIEGDILKNYLSIINLFDFYNGKKWISCKNEKDGRIHTNLTSMKKKHRHLIRDKDNEKFVEIDISASVPFFALNALKNYSIILNDKNLNLSVNQRNVLLLVGSIFDKIKDSSDGMFRAINHELDYILDRITTNSFYSILDDDPELLKMDYSEKKKEILSYFFAEVGTKNRIEKLFLNKLPSFHKILTAIKSKHVWKNYLGFEPIEKPHLIVCYLLFHLEADMILNQVSKNLYKRIQKITIATIHDSVLIPRSKLETSLKTIKETFIEYYGIEPYIKYNQL